MVKKKHDGGHAWEVYVVLNGRIHICYRKNFAEKVELAFSLTVF